MSSPHNKLTSLSSTKRNAINLGLTRIKKALELINNPCADIAAIQIVGTNGKGSIASFLENCLIEAGINVGCTTSPHLFNWCERIRVKGQKISNNEFESHILKIKEISSDLTEFELVIACALDYFASKKVELIILEAGLGGRLDATTAHSNRPLIAIGSIGLDHCEYLGETLEEITREKASVISKGSKVISSIQHKKVKEVLEEMANKKKAIIKWVKPLSKSWDLGIPGEIQRKNAAVAKAIIEELKTIGLQVDKNQIISGLKNTNWPGRLQKTSWKDMPILLDGAHNLHAAKELAKERLLWGNNYKGVKWILGIQSNKQGPEMVQSLLKVNDDAWIIPVPNHQSWTAMEISRSCPNLSHQIHHASKIEEVLDGFLYQGEWPDPCPIIAGSLFLFEGFISKKLI